MVRRSAGRRPAAAGKRLPRPAFNWFTRLAFLFFFLLGGLVFNLDRLDQFWPAGRRYVVRLLPRNLRPGAGAETGRAEAGATLSGRIIDVYDGDTALLLSDDGAKKYKIRFFGIDAPESSQRGGTESGDFLRRLIDGKNVTVEVVSVDLYGRQVGKVRTGDLYVNLEMGRAGQAWHYAAYAAGETDRAAAAAAARRAGTGLWREPSPQPPWEYRRERK